jgi:hypothetical protein
MKLDWPHVGALLAVLACVIVLAFFAYKSDDPNAWQVYGTVAAAVLALGGAAFRGQSLSVKASLAAKSADKTPTQPPVSG